MNEEFKTGMMVDETMKADLLSAAKWAKFLCIVGCIGWLFLVIAGMRSYLKFTGILTIIVLVIYLIMGIVAGIGFLAMQNGAQ